MRGVIAALGLALAAVAAAGWVLSSRLLVPEPYGLMPEFAITDVSEAAVTLPLVDEPSQFADVTKEGTYGLLWEGGSGLLGPARRIAADAVVRPLDLVAGSPPRPGAPARLDVTLFHRDPRRDLGIPFEEISLRSDAGALSAWWIDRGGSRAALMLHGRRRSDRTETLRLLPTLVGQGFSVLVLAYRNHGTSAPSPDGLYHYGASEYRDALAGLAELRRRGVTRTVVVGYSMGGAVALETIKRWPRQGPALDALVLDSPLLDPRPVFVRGAEAAGLPFPRALIGLAMTFGRWRAGVDWRELDQRRYAPELEVPLLLIAGTADGTIPIELVDDFAARVRAPLEYRRLEGVDHVEGWNADPAAYEAAVRAFLAPYAPAAP